MKVIRVDDAVYKVVNERRRLMETQLGRKVSMNEATWRLIQPDRHVMWSGRLKDLS